PTLPEARRAAVGDRGGCIRDSRCSGRRIRWRPGWGVGGRIRRSVSRCICRSISRRVGGSISRGVGGGISRGVGGRVSWCVSRGFGWVVGGCIGWGIWGVVGGCVGGVDRGGGGGGYDSRRGRERGEGDNSAGLDLVVAAPRRYAVHFVPFEVVRSP